MEDMLPLGEEPKEEELLVKELLKLMCDKKTGSLYLTGCFVLSPDFKLTALRSGLLKATLDESMLWHRRLGHVKFKTINKLVKENLVRGLPTKRFENDQTCVACLKGKQHKASFVIDDYSRLVSRANVIENQAMIDQGVTAALAARDADRSMNGDDNHNSGTGVRGFRNATISHDVANALTWTDLKKKMSDKYCLRGEIKKLEVEMFPEESDKIEKYVDVCPDMIRVVYFSVVESSRKPCRKLLK
ncbi:putative ribonuclease H-like domain-containing protein [Tanacetum coccineum]